MPSSHAKPPLSRRLFFANRRWHSWLGLGFLPLILIVSLTGILLNHKPFFFPPAKGLEESGLLIARKNLSAGEGIRSPLEILEVATFFWGEAHVEKVELREMGGIWFYKVMDGKGGELLFHAQTGERLSPKIFAGEKGAGTDWKKLTGALHSGKIVGLSGRLLMDLAALILIFLSLSGLFLWSYPRWRKGKKDRPAGRRPGSVVDRLPEKTGLGQAAEG